MELGPGGSSGRFETGVLHRISIPFTWAEWFCLGSHFWKNHQISRKVHFFKNVHVQKIQKCHFSEKKPPEAQRRTQPVAFTNTVVYIILYMYIYTHTSRKSKTSLWWIYYFLKKSEKVTFCQKARFWWKFQVEIKNMMKPKMVRTVHRNILYSVDLKICDSKVSFRRNLKIDDFDKLEILGSTQNGSISSLATSSGAPDRPVGSVSSS